jgi:hypothetical protein
MSLKEAENMKKARRRTSDVPEPAIYTTPHEL